MRFGSEDSRQVALMEEDLRLRILVEVCEELLEELRNEPESPRRDALIRDVEGLGDRTATALGQRVIAKLP
jgi:hypothetical protein